MGHYSEKQDLFPLDGGCACGFIRYRMHLPPIVVHCCHCTSCQRETGSALVVNAIIEGDQVTLLPSAPPTVPGSKAAPNCLPAGPPLIITTTSNSVRHSPEPNFIPTPSESGVGQTIARCPHCAVAVWSNYDGAGPLLKFVRACTLDQAWEVAPDVHIYTRSRRDFFEITDGKPQFEEFYPNKGEVYRKEAMTRFENLLPKIMAYREEKAKGG